VLPADQKITALYDFADRLWGGVAGLGTVEHPTSGAKKAMSAQVLWISATFINLMRPMYTDLI
jgi:hypothetical protein